MRLLAIVIIGLFLFSCKQETKTEKRQESAAKTWSLFVGSYANAENEGIYTVSLDGESGTLEFNGLAARAINPSFLNISGDYLYSVSESGSGSILSFRIDKRTLRLFPIDTLEYIGSAPCYISTDDSGFNGYVANYMGGSVVKFETDNMGRFLAEPITISHKGSGPYEGRQEGPHAHSINFNPSQSLLYAADLGADKIFIYDPSTMDSRGEIQMDPGDGPRHFTFNSSGNRLYVINELSSTISVFNISSGGAELIQKISTLPEDYDGPNKTADIHLHPSGKFLYGSNRGHDSIAFYKVDGDGKLSGNGWINEGVSWPRNFTVTDDGKWMVVANRNSNTLSSYSVQDGIPGAPLSIIEVKTPVYLGFYE